MQLRNSRYQLVVLYEGQPLVARTGDNLSRLTACLFNLLEHDYPNARGEIRNLETNEIVRQSRRLRFG